MDDATGPTYKPKRPDSDFEPWISDAGGVLGVLSRLKFLVFGAAWIKFLGQVPFDDNI